MSLRSKLVRDQIPSIITANGQTPTISEVTGPAYLEALFQKIDEECQELRADRSAEEVADVLEVLMALTKALGFDWQEVEQLRIAKLRERGGFEKGLMLESVKK